MNKAGLEAWRPITDYYKWNIRRDKFSLWVWPEDGELMVSGYEAFLSPYYYVLKDGIVFNQPYPEKLGWIYIGECT